VHAHAADISRRATAGDTDTDTDTETDTDETGLAHLRPATLRSMDLFAGLPDGELEEMAQRGSVSTAHPGQVVQAQDVPVRMWHVVMAGHAVVQHDGVPIGLLGRGNSWSEHSLLNRLPSPIAVVALSPLTLLTLSRRTFFEIPDHHPVLAGRLVARSATSADRLALPVFNALAQRADTEWTGGCRAGRYH
jgi:signal-transduction protein with cAMP-binding, CBS, and nucleotidyltransferase domain